MHAHMYPHMRSAQAGAQHARKQARMLACPLLCAYVYENESRMCTCSCVYPCGYTQYLLVEQQNASTLPPERHDRKWRPPIEHLKSCSGRLQIATFVNVGDLTVRIQFWGKVYYTHIKKPPKIVLIILVRKLTFPQARW